MERKHLVSAATMNFTRPFHIGSTAALHERNMPAPASGVLGHATRAR